MYSVLIIDKEPLFRDLLGLYFGVDYSVIKESNQEDAIENLSKQKIDLIIMSIHDAWDEGLETCKKIRLLSDAPVIVLMDIMQDELILEFYNVDVDDCLPHNSDPKIILAKSKRILERLVPENSVLRFSDVVIDRERAIVTAGGNEIKLTNKEFKILLLLARNPKIVFPREFIIESLWGYEYLGNTRIVDTHVKNLRRKLGDRGSMIKTVIPVGYKLEY
ncbi:MAG: response regulator transcription factor [Anaerovoracaceae bacterium]